MYVQNWKLSSSRESFVVNEDLRFRHSRAITKSGLEILIRPLGPDDAPLLLELFKTFSPESIYFRFLRRLVGLSQEMLNNLTRIDMKRNMAYAAIQELPSGDRLLGVVRLMADCSGRNGEFAIAIGDPWQGQGVGAALLERCIEVAKASQLKRIWGLVLPENSKVLALGRKLGFSVRRVPNTPVFEISLNLSVNPDQPQ